jgi:RTX calcium-binding nonapeptide repeat (4 copies)
METTDGNPADMEFLYSLWQSAPSWPGLFQAKLHSCKVSAHDTTVLMPDWSERKLLMAIQRNDLITLNEAKDQLSDFYQAVEGHGLLIQLVRTGVMIVYPGLENDPGNNHFDVNNPAGGNGQDGSDPDGENGGGSGDPLDRTNGSDQNAEFEGNHSDHDGSDQGGKNNGGASSGNFLATDDTGGALTAILILLISLTPAILTKIQIFGRLNLSNVNLSGAKSKLIEDQSIDFDVVVGCDESLLVENRQNSNPSKSPFLNFLSASSFSDTGVIDKTDNSRIGLEIVRNNLSLQTEVLSWPQQSVQANPSLRIPSASYVLQLLPGMPAEPENPYQNSSNFPIGAPIHTDTDSQNGELLTISPSTLRPGKSTVELGQIDLVATEWLKTNKFALVESNSQPPLYPLEVPSGETVVEILWVPSTVETPQAPYPSPIAPPVQPQLPVEVPLVEIPNQPEMPVEFPRIDIPPLVDLPNQLPYPSPIAPPVQPRFPIEVPLVKIPKQPEIPVESPPIDMPPLVEVPSQPPSPSPIYPPLQPQVPETEIPTQPILKIDLSNQGGQIVIPTDGRTVEITNFTGVGRGSNPDPKLIPAIDTIQFIGSGLIAKYLQMEQQDRDLVITFEGSDLAKVVLKNTALDTIDNLDPATGASALIGNIYFDGDEKIQDSFDVFNSDWYRNTVLNSNTTTFLNDLDNFVYGFDNSDDFINGQGGNDTLFGLGGNDILRGGAGNDILVGGLGHDRLVGNTGQDIFVISPSGLSDIMDFTFGKDKIGLSGGITYDSLKFRTGTDSCHGGTQIWQNNQLVMNVFGVAPNQLTSDQFIPWQSKSQLS